jgi:hypothetical protein
LRVPVLARDPSPFSSFWNLPVLLGNGSSPCLVFGESVLSHDAAPFSSMFGMPVLARNAATLSAKLGLPLISKGRSA